jgi:hypothetical protein
MSLSRPRDFAVHFAAHVDHAPDCRLGEIDLKCLIASRFAHSIALLGLDYTKSTDHAAFGDMRVD